ncbi:MAG: aromatic amino acid aminotransferase [Gammaproteobacteria bacterium]|nr:MAG: aromatic amino acid aminotransferase [Gammaproteobacteria bacterium]
MFEKIPALPGDPILELTGLYKKDPRADKIDVGVGVFKTPEGNTPVLKAVRIAEQQLHDTQTSKAYVDAAGDPAFIDNMLSLVFADSVDYSRLRGVQAPGGTGALGISAAMLYNNMPEKTVWVSDPTWGNHVPIFEAAGFTVKKYPYFDQSTRMVDEAKVIDALSKMGENDIVLLHGCCHNPTGSDLSPKAWDKIAELAVNNGFLPFLDLAYQGFGDGLDKDLYGVRKLAATVSDMVVTSSCSKNFGLYRDRVGCAMVLGKDSSAAEAVKGHICKAARVLYSMAPDHGAAIVGIILGDAELTKVWKDELAHMRHRMLELRHMLAKQMQIITNTNDWDFIDKHRGMFSLLSLDKSQTDSLINDYGVYLVAGGRINIAGLRGEEQVKRFAECLAAVTR